MNLQEKVRAFIAANNMACGAEIRYIDLVSEIGEVGKALLKSGNYGKAVPTATENTAEELGDCLFSLLALCAELDIDAETALETVLEKYAARIAAKGEAGSGR